MKYITLEDRFSVPSGTLVYSLKYCDYGLASDDSRLTGMEHKSVTLSENGGYPSFTIAKRNLAEVK